MVGEGATADGSFLVARAADSNALKAQHFVIHPAKHNQSGMYRTRDHNGATNFEYPLPKDSMRYTTVPNWKTQLHGAVGYNEAGLGISATESIFARPDALKLDPYVGVAADVRHFLQDDGLRTNFFCHEGCGKRGTVGADHYNVKTFCKRGTAHECQKCRRNESLL